MTSVLHTEHHSHVCPETLIIAQTETETHRNKQKHIETQRHKMCIYSNTVCLVPTVSPQSIS